MDEAFVLEWLGIGAYCWRVVMEKKAAMVVVAKRPGKFVQGMVAGGGGAKSRVPSCRLGV